MKSAQEIFDQYTHKIKQASTAEEKAKAKAIWDNVYGKLSDDYKAEIRIILKQRAKILLESQQILDERILANGLPSYQVFLNKMHL